MHDITGQLQVRGVELLQRFVFVERLHPESHNEPIRAAVPPALRPRRLPEQALGSQSCWFSTGGARRRIQWPPRRRSAIPSAGASARKSCAPSPQTLPIPTSERGFLESLTAMMFLPSELSSDGKQWASADRKQMPNRMKNEAWSSLAGSAPALISERIGRLASAGRGRSRTSRTRSSRRC